MLDHIIEVLDIQLNAKITKNHSEDLILPLSLFSLFTARIFKLMFWYSFHSKMIGRHLNESIFF